MLLIERDPPITDDRLAKHSHTNIFREFRYLYFCHLAALPQLCTFLNTVQYLSLHRNLDSRAHTVQLFSQFALV